MILAGCKAPLSVSEQTPSTPGTNVSQFSAASYLQARKMAGYLQPSADFVKLISPIYTKADGNGVVPEGNRGAAVIIVNDVPFYRYGQSGEDKYAFHPMSLGRFLGRLSCDDPIQRYLDAAVGMAYKLENGGLLWYYPDNYLLNRFLGPDIAPSAIGQGEVLGAITLLDQQCSLDLSDLARQVFLGMDFNYYQGGVNLENRALLEIPLFRSAPEIILNGWLHALLNLRQYAEYYNDAQAKLLFSSNVAFLADSLASFNDKATGLSLYSDLSPYQVRVYHQDGPLNNLAVFYAARTDDLQDLSFDLAYIEQTDQSPYDNQLIDQADAYTDIWVSCSQRYDTYLVTNEAPFSVSFAAGKYDPLQSTPGQTGEKIEFSSISVDGYYVVNITEARDKLFCGYPTNFSKSKENYYHAYHVVALACLLTTPDLLAETRTSLDMWMENWIQAADKLTNTNTDGYHFTSYDAQLATLADQHVCNVADDWKTLLQMAEAGSQ
jgi:hypothetical protein